MKSKKVAVGMSGGVDSSVAAAILVDQGYDVTGVFIEAYNEPGCRTDQDRKDALAVAVKLGIKFQTIDVRREYKEKVVNYFLDTYKSGRTPNPDVVCNREVKFGIFYDWARKRNHAYVATGHYARITKNGSLYLQRAKDETKDQSYFLWQVPQEHLEHVIFPLGGMLKQQVREKAKELGLPNADKPDSMGVCMMGEFNLREFLKNKLGEKTGEVLLKYPSIPVSQYPRVGEHRGLWFHTVGQRGGFELDKTVLKKLGYKTEEMEPLYVVGKDRVQNKLVVGTREQAYSAKLSIINYQLSMNYHLDKLQTLVAEGKLFVRIRNLGELYRVAGWSMVNGQWSIRTEEPLFAVAEGQAAVIYARFGGEGDEVVVGGGEIGV